MARPGGAVRASGRRGIEAGFGPPASWWTFRGFLANVVFYWRTSLPFRTITLSVALTTATVLSVGLVMSNTIASDLFDSRLNQAKDEHARATTWVQNQFDSGEATDEVGQQALMSDAAEAFPQSAPNAVGSAILLPERDGLPIGPEVQKGRLKKDQISAGLRASVQNGASGQQYYQSTSIDVDGETVPAVIFGSQLRLPGAGTVELYHVYSFAEAQRSLDFVQRTLVGSMIVLVLIIAVITGFVMRAVIQPIRMAAQTSRKLAAGRLEERIPESGEDDIATLGRSFNDMADSLQEQIEALAHLSKVQQRFVSDVSHELRTPLTTIRLAGTMLFDNRDDFDPVTSRSVELLHDQIERFELLLADLLEISRFDAGAVELLFEENSLSELCDEAIGSMTPVALDHGSELVLRTPGPPVVAQFDRRRVQRVVRNLLGNAIEHGEGRPIVVSVGANETAVAVSVRDYGVGMTDQQRDRAFDRFWRADPSRKRTMGGSGLGLAISNEDAQLHHGRLEVWSELGQGSNFLLTLPREVGAPIATSPLPLEPDDAGATPDEVDVAGAAAETFASEDVDTQPIVLPALDGRRAIAAAPERPRDARGAADTAAAETDAADTAAAETGAADTPAADASGSTVDAEEDRP